MSEKNKDQNKSGEEETKDLFDKSLEDGTIEQDKDKDKEKKDK
ncbi:hypothetical protein [Alkalicoccobacillus murimartini]|uniref:DUF4025 domain-containing protein n=1 Tax=Alkalicoccobacillus murimartini TaxID=171685 RepID=A0ABT9YE79_9BACI|nr:hypothetical protein [Alkalicoccobacillus murimartini]MDQ0206155.1 hypothetical protein [Alkalicoccobacillus murimartini]